MALRYGLWERVDEATRALALVLVGSGVSWTGGALLLLVTRPEDLGLASALLGFVSLAAIVAVVWGVYFAVDVLRAYGPHRRLAWIAVVVGGATLVPWLVYLFVGQ